MKKRFSLMLALALVLALALSLAVSAEYIPCNDGTGDHDMSEWSLVATNPDGSTTLERTCAKCGYVQKGFSGASADPGAVGTTRSENIAVTTSADLLVGTTDEAPAAPAVNPSTGARL